MAKRNWKLKKTWKAKRQGQVWIVKNENGNIGYFKFATKKQHYFSGPLIANEYVSAALAKQLGFPVADLELTTVVGPNGRKQRGIVSVATQANEVITWKKAAKEVHQRPEEYVNQIELLSKLIVFDVWITNIDRATGKNLILYRHNPDEKYDWYLIDHGLALFGSPRKWKLRGHWKSPVWEKVWIFHHVPKGLLRLQSSLDTLQPMIKQIESLSEAEIDAALDSVPRGCMKESERIFIKRLLRYRQKRLQGMIRRWLNYQGIKECMAG